MVTVLSWALGRRLWRFWKQGGASRHCLGSPGLGVVRAAATLVVDDGKAVTAVEKTPDRHS